MMTNPARWLGPTLLSAGLLLSLAGCGTGGAGTPKSMHQGGGGSTSKGAGGKGGAGRPSIATHAKSGSKAHGGAMGTPSTRSTGLHVVGFAVNAQHASFEAVQNVPHLVSEVAPFWYSVQTTGAVKAMTNATTRSWANSHGVPLMPLFNNANSASAVLADPNARSTAVANIAAIVKKEDYDGASIDFQGLNATPTVRAGLVTFTSQLAQRLHSMGKRLTVNVIPTLQATAEHGAYDETALAKSADQIILMAYDRHSTGSAPGPVAPMPWVKQAVAEAKNYGVKPQQILLGVANYGYDWPQGSTNAATVSYAQVQAMNVKPVWDATSGEYHFTYTKNGTTHTVWYSGTRSLAEKVSLAKSQNLSGIAIWRLGYDNATYWKAVANTVGTNVPKGGTVEGRPMKFAPGSRTSSSTAGSAGRPHKSGTKGSGTPNKPRMVHTGKRLPMPAKKGSGRSA